MKLNSILYLQQKNSHHSLQQVTPKYYLDEGGEAKLYLADYLGMDVVIRQVLDIQWELEIVSNLRHPNLVLFIGTYSLNQIVYEYMQKGSLYQLLYQDNVTFNDEQIVSISQQLIKALHYLHRHGITHNDINASNILVNEQNVFKIGDFGRSRRNLNHRSTRKDRRDLAQVIFECRSKRVPTQSDLANLNSKSCRVDRVISQLINSECELDRVLQMTNE